MNSLRITMCFLLIGSLFAMVIQDKKTNKAEDNASILNKKINLRGKESKKKIGKYMSDKMMASYSAMIREMQDKSVGKPNLKVGSMVRSMKPGQNPEEMGTYMEGDILTVRGDSVDGVKGRPHFRWPKGVVHYRINGDFSGDELSKIYRAMESFHNFTCIRFKPWSEEVENFISIEDAYSGCWSTLGRAGGMQRLNLQRGGCISTVGTPIHEFMHALGIDHEHNRNDRDEHVKINFHNIRRGSYRNFKKQPLFVGLGLKYNYGSVLHYGRYVFSKNGEEPTIKPVKKTTENIGQRRGFSLSDIERINRLYDCRSSDVKYNHTGLIPAPNTEDW